MQKPNQLKFVVALTTAIAKIDPKRKIGASPVEPSDHVIGELPKELRQFVLYLIDEKDALSKLTDAHQAEHVSAGRVGRSVDLVACKKTVDGLKERSRRLELYRSMFWEEVRATFPQFADKESVGFRDNGTLVWSDPMDNESRLAELLGDLLSGRDGGEGVMLELGPEGLRPMGRSPFSRPHRR